MDNYSVTQDARASRLERRARYLASRSAHFTAVSTLLPSPGEWLRLGGKQVGVKAGTKLSIAPRSAAAILSGRVDLLLKQGASAQAIAGLESGLIFGDLPILGMRMFDEHAVVADDCELVVFSEAMVQRALSGSPEMAVGAIKTIGQRLAESEMELMLARFGAVRPSLIWMILDLATGSGSVHNLSHRELGDRLGKDRVVISRALGDLARRRLIETSHKSIRLIDVEGLTSLMWEGLS